jgi:thymidylate synthase (FAD)
MEHIRLVGEKKDIYGDEIGFVQYWDFSRANISKESRIEAITKVASICYQSPKAFGSEVLYNRLKAESIGLPSSSFEFVPVLLDLDNPVHRFVFKHKDSVVRKFSEKIDYRYVLTNYRAIVYDYEINRDQYDGYDSPENIFNTEEECNIIRRHFKVFLFKSDIATRTQAIRHRVNWQELSRRYVSGKKLEFEYLITDDMKDIKVNYATTVPGCDVTQVAMLEISLEDYIKLGEAFYNKAIGNNVKPQNARRVIPQMMYTQYWGGFTDSYYDNFIKLRKTTKAQKEIRILAETMEELVKSRMPE